MELITGGNFRRTEKYAVAFMIIVVIILLGISIWYVSTQSKSGKKSTFTFNDRSEFGYSYDVVERKFVSKVDRPIAVSALQKQLERKGQRYSLEQLNILRDSLIINILESDDDEFANGLIATIPLLTNPRYKEAIAIVNNGANSGFKLRNTQERELIYGMLLSYFTALRTPLTIRLDQFSDELLITTFRTLKRPSEADLTKKRSTMPVVREQVNSGFFSL